jgi:tetratricopeptide (TPR) repeat protein
MKRDISLALLFVGAILVASPLALPSDNIQKQCMHAAELISQGDLQGAQSELDALLRKNPEHENARDIIGVTLTKLSEQFEKQGDRTRAVAVLREALRLDPDEAYWHIKKWSINCLDTGKPIG